MGVPPKGGANVIGAGLAQSELTNATSAAACDDTDNCFPARAGVALAVSSPVLRSQVLPVSCGRLG